MAKLQMAMLMARINLLDGPTSFKDQKTWSNVVVCSMMRGWPST